jgi:hypothetical protein
LQLLGTSVGLRVRQEGKEKVLLSSFSLTKSTNIPPHPEKKEKRNATKD